MAESRERDSRFPWNSWSHFYPSSKQYKRTRDSVEMDREESSVRGRLMLLSTRISFSFRTAVSF